MTDCDLIRMLRFPGSPPIQLRAAEEILRLREEEELLNKALILLVAEKLGSATQDEILSEINRILSSLSQPTG